MARSQWKPLFKNLLRSQDIANLFRPSGCLFLYSTKDFENYKKFKKRKNYGFYSKKDTETVNIDKEEDFLKLQFLLKTGKTKLS